MFSMYLVLGETEPDATLKVYGSCSAHVLGDECNSDWECKENIAGSICHRGRCLCQPFYARVNQTACVQSTLLGYDCIVPEQCSLKVANSSCLDGTCRCVDGFLQFRKHTCLGRGLYLNPYSPSRGIDIATSASRLFFSERRSATVTDDESPIMDAHTRKPIGVLPGRHMGLFRNNINKIV
ncbi:hypothetical protein Zmor_026212 [Zophobas morio]|uniref:EB domain-containing protein n=1 Tax=Zophobas morio TaxID=2755281 RepID=A0AA38M4C7_9CUCU|nr:hypothetical protein Zmor_026212 [Zophobas morio]